MMPRLLLLILLFAAAFTEAGCKENPRTKQMESIDWKSLAFKCTWEAKPGPPRDDEAEHWYQTANRLYKSGTDKQLVEHAQLLRRAAEHGHIKAMNNLVLAYLNGDGVEQSDKQAVHWAEEMMKLESASGYYHMGTFLEQGIGVKQDRKAALTYFRKAADLGSAQGQLVVGKTMVEAFYAPEIPLADKDKGMDIATNILRCALNQKLADAGYELGMHYAYRTQTNSPWRRDQTADALQAFQAAAKLGNEDSLFWLYNAFNEGSDGVEKDPKRAATYYQLLEEVREDKTKRFPNLDSLCPLPPKPMTGNLK